MARCLACMLAVLATQFISLAQAPPSSAKLFPQVTEGIVNADGRLVMNCVIGDDGLTVTDLAWHDFAPPPGKGKRWNFNQTPYTETPLVDFHFDPCLAGLQLCINVEVFDIAKPWEVLETYQEILQLGGTPKLGLPAWFHVPQNRLLYDFHEGTWFPSGWRLPKGKYACWEGAGPYDLPARNGRHPMLDFGFTHVAENTFPVDGTVPDWAQQCRVFGDAEWLDMGDGENQARWRNDGWKSRGRAMKIVIPDFENAGHWRWNQTQYDTFRDLVLDFRRDCPNCLFGCWGIGVTRRSLRIFDAIDAEGRPTGVRSLDAAAQWRAMYNAPRAERDPVFDRGRLSFGNPSVYWLNGGNPAHLYAVVQEWEVGKLARPDVPDVVSTWIQTEFVDGYPLSTYRFPGPDGSAQWRGIKHQAPPSLVYAMSLFAHCRMDGAYCWETGNIYSEAVADAGVLGEGGMQRPVPRTTAGVTKQVYYLIKYFGFYNYHVLGMWQAGQCKDIIEASTDWFMPEIRTSTNQVWRTGDERYPSYCSYHKEPLVRAKYAASGDELLVIACNPYNRGLQHVEARDPRTGRTETFDLVSDYPVIRRFPATAP